MIDAIALAVERVTASVLRALSRGEEPTAAALRWLLRRYGATADERVRDALEPALAWALDAWPRAPRDHDAGWLLLCVDAVALSDDDRLRDAASELAARVRESWGHEDRTARAAEGVDACLRVVDADTPPATFQAAIDELERIVAGVYRPGEGASGTIGGNHPRGRLADQIAISAALLTAFERTGRLPYSMLAEELMQYARRVLWDDEAGRFRDGDAGHWPFALNCETVVVLRRLALLHRSDDYRRVAVLAADADYGRDAERILLSLAPVAPGLDLEGAVYGLAADWP